MKTLGVVDKRETGRWMNNSRREFEPAIPTTGAGNASVPADAESAEIRRLARLHSQPIRFAALRVNQERTLISRQTFKERRTAALTEWRLLCAA